MPKRFFTFLTFALFSVGSYAQVYKCEDETSVSFSSIPCDNPLIDLEVTEQAIVQNNAPHEQFITPIYPGWKMGWRKIKDQKLQRFREIVYAPLQFTESQSATRIVKQTLTNLPQSMNVQLFARSVEDILDTLCTELAFTQLKVDANDSNNVFYAQYACSYRRDTRQGERGELKIIRGDNSLYMLTVKWEIAPFTLQKNNPFRAVEGALHNREIMAQHYLQQEVRLCRAGNCLH